MSYLNEFLKNVALNKLNYLSNQFVYEWDFTIFLAVCEKFKRNKNSFTRINNSLA